MRWNYLPIRSAISQSISLSVCQSVDQLVNQSINQSMSLCPTGVKKPHFHEPLKNVTCAEGKSVRLECKFTGEPTPTIHWMRNDVGIMPSGVFKVNGIADLVPGLTIQQTMRWITVSLTHSFKPEQNGHQFSDIFRPNFLNESYSTYW